jgi:DNA polymerase-3 subunit delta'
MKTQSGSREIIGNRGTIETLRRVASSPSMGHAYLFLGPDGVGKRLAGIEFARAINCRCNTGTERCESCRLIDSLSHPELLVLEDVNKPRWLRRGDVLALAGIDGDDWLEQYDGLLAGLQEKGYLKEPLPRTNRQLAVDGFNVNSDELFGKGSVPSRECYTPGPISEKVRKHYDGGDLSEAEYRLVKYLYEYPLSVMPYRGAIPIAYVTQRQGWKHTRPVQSFLAVKTMLEGKKVVIIDDAQKMTPEAQNCLLKTLEEPPPDSVLILVSSDKQGLFQTIISRCQTIEFGRLTRSEVDAAVENLLGGGDDDTKLAALLSGNCPGRLLELSLIDIGRRLRLVRDLFAGIGDGRTVGAFGFSARVLAEGGTHRRKQRQMVGDALELLLFWLVQVLHVKHGRPEPERLAQYADDLKAQAMLFDNHSLLGATHQIEAAFGLLRWNIDMSLLLDDLILRLADTLTSQPEDHAIASY